ncbi:MAG: 3-deoxy-8-phosphooctulonate synthase, partial [Candidatus Omnitrophica bacterium]|nr:3-deoxy-8-phosphooctulonate synthase [Candidatus Omnitrophota bacterium]
MIKTVAVDKIKFGAKGPFVLISGPCVIENRAMVLSMAKRLKEITSRVGIPFVFKASYDKANRTSYKSFRGPGLEKGLDILQEVKERVGVPVTSDIHAVE